MFLSAIPWDDTRTVWLACSEAGAQDDHESQQNRPELGPLGRADSRRIWISFDYWRLIGPILLVALRGTIFVTLWLMVRSLGVPTQRFMEKAFDEWITPMGKSDLAQFWYFIVFFLVFSNCLSISLKYSTIWFISSSKVVMIEKWWAKSSLLDLLCGLLLVALMTQWEQLHWLDSFSGSNGPIGVLRSRPLWVCTNPLWECLLCWLIVRRQHTYSNKFSETKLQVLPGATKMWGTVQIQRKRRNSSKSQNEI